MNVLTFYTKPGCSLCDQGYPLVEELAERFGLEVRRVDIRSDPALVERHGQRIPVLELDGEELGWGRLSARALERNLARRAADREAQGFKPKRPRT